MGNVPVPFHPIRDRWRVDPTWGDRADARTLGSMLQCGTASETDHPMLRCRVSRAARKGIAAQSIDRSVIDDHRCARLFHCRYFGIHAQEHGCQISIDRLAPRLLSHLRNRSQSPTAAAIVESIVEAAVRFHDVVHQTYDGLTVSSIAREPLHIPQG